MGFVDVRHRNIVILTGKLRIQKAGVVNRQGIDLLEVFATVQVGDKNRGGLHKIMIYGREARVASAFVEANGKDGMEVTVNGCLYSGSERSFVYVERIAFHVGSRVREKAISIMRGGKPQSKRGTGPLRRTEVKPPEAA